MQSFLLLLVFSFLIMGVTSNTSLASENNSVIKGLDAKVAYMSLHLDGEEEDEDEDDEEEEERI